MDEANLKRVRALWPDVAEPFSRIVPDGCTLIRADDEWLREPSPVRIRAIELAPDASAPPLEAIVEEASEDAERRGWTRSDEVDDAWELEGVLLRIRAVGGHLRVQFDQPWPSDFVAPVDTSEAFQNLVRKALALPGTPRRLGKRLDVDPFQPTRTDRVDEWVELPLDTGLLARFARSGFSYEEDQEAWIAKLSDKESNIVAKVREGFDSTRVEMSKTRLKD